MREGEAGRFLQFLFELASQQIALKEGMEEEKEEEEEYPCGGVSVIVSPLLLLRSFQVALQHFITSFFFFLL